MADILDLEVLQDEAMALDEEDNIVVKLKQSVKKRKGRGFASDAKREPISNYESIKDFAEETSDLTAQRSIEGYILMVTGIHEEAHEDDVHGKFADYGEVKNLHLNLDRRTGFLKGYALIEYESFKEAQEAKLGLNGTELLGAKISVDWTFVKKPVRISRKK